MPDREREREREYIKGSTEEHHLSSYRKIKPAWKPTGDLCCVGTSEMKTEAALRLK